MESSKGMVTNSFLILGSKVIIAVLNFILIVILSRYLSIEDFGLFALVVAMQALFQVLLDAGLSPAYIKSNNPSSDLRNTFFTINIVLGGINFILLIIIAPILSMIYSNDDLMYLILIFSISVLISSFGFQGMSELLREKRFFTITKISILATFITFILSFIAAYIDMQVWSFIVKAITMSTATTLLIFYYNGFHHNIVNLNTIKVYIDELRFGYEIFKNRMLNGLFNSSDKFFIGVFSTVGDLGQYTNAQNITRMIDTNIRMSIGTVVYSYIERYSNTSRRNFYDKYAVVVFIATILFNGIIILEGDLLFLHIFGDKWLEASQYIQFFAFLSTGITLKGIYITISMSENNMKKQNILTFYGLMILFMSIIITYLFSLSLYIFIITFSLSIFLFWLVTLYYELKIHNKNSMFIKYVFFIYSIIFILLYLRYFVLANSIEEAVILCTTFITMLLLISYHYYIKFIKEKNVKFI